MVYRSAAPRSVLLKQLDSLTWATRGSPGGTKVMSTHCCFSKSALHFFSFNPVDHLDTIAGNETQEEREREQQHTEYKAAP